VFIHVFLSSFFESENSVRLWRYRIITISAPGMTPDYSSESEICSGKNPMNFKSLNGIL